MRTTSPSAITNGARRSSAEPALFTVEERDRLRTRLLERAEADDAVVGAAFTGSEAVAVGDRWSDTDLVLAVRGDLGSTVARWTGWFYDEWDARHHWDLAVAPGVIRVYLLRGWLELDLTFTPETDFGPRGPQWRTIFGRPRSLEPFPDPDRNTLIGLVWHHAFHAWICLRRDRWWQAEHWISAIRDQVITLACLRLGHPAAYAKGAHLLPEEITDSLTATLVRSLTKSELERALTAAVNLATAELERSDAGAAARLNPMLFSLTADPNDAKDQTH